MGALCAIFSCLCKRFAAVTYTPVTLTLTTMADSEKKEDSKESEHINLKVTGQDGSVVHFKIKKNTPLRKLMGAYCNRAGIQTGVVRFRFDGNPINDEDTPAMLEMEDGDSIDVFQQQTGGYLI